MAERARIVGIDLGTTHTVVAHAEPSAGARAEVFPLAQFVGDGEIATRALLPSVLFAPASDERRQDSFGDAPWVIGVHARARGQRAPGRTITSAKSWLGHAAVDRLAPTLPWGSDSTDSTLPRISPVEASRRILSHVRRVYDSASPERPLAEQHIVLTVPASFDEVARELTVRAAADAGLTVRLLEEPLAAFYDHLSLHGTRELEALAASREAFVLICDVGGGTTDLTLIRVGKTDDGVRLDRVAVGRHLLLGGDNMDLTLAHAVEPQIVEPPDHLEPALFSELVLACRSAKEQLLDEHAPESAPIRVLSRGSRLVGSTLAASLERARVEALILDGFFPIVDSDVQPAIARTGLLGFGLPYERDPAITRHAVAFLQRHLPTGAPPTAVLLNGGVFRSGLVRRRFLDSLEGATTHRAAELPAPDPDLAVARGAVAFGLSLVGIGPQIGGGSARAYYVGLRAGDEHRRAICIVPRGATEGERHVVAVPGLSVVVGEPVRFDLFSSDSGRDAPGAVIDVSTNIDPLPSMTAAFDVRDTVENRVAVHLEGELTAVGTLDVACVEDRASRSAHTEQLARHFRLAFDLRENSPRVSSRPPMSIRPSDGKLEAARESLRRVFGKGRSDVEAREARHLVRDLERLLGERPAWTTEVSRSLYDVLVPESRARRRSADHERTFWMLAGFCLRPGYGYPGDEKRVGKLVPLFTELVGFPEEARSWQQFWIAWRRVCGGLNETSQTNVRDYLDPYLSTDDAKPKKRKGPKPDAEDEMLELASSLEAVSPGRRADLGRWVLERTWTDRDPRLWKALGKIGARVPTYASAHHVVPPNTVERWLDHLLREKWQDVPTAAPAAVQLARLTGDRARDVSQSFRQQIAARLETVNGPPAWRRAVLEVVPIEESDRAEFFGESLPVGLELVRMK